MIIRLDTVVLERFTWEESVGLSAAELAHPEILELTPVTVRGTLEPAASDFVLEATLSFGVSSPCARCTAPVSETVETAIDLVVTVGEARRGDESEIALREEDLGIVEVAGGVLDTRPLIAEQVLLELPVRALCSANCAGLCSSCGADLNRGSCGCPRLAGDSRWSAALGEIKARLDGDA